MAVDLPDDLRAFLSARKRLRYAADECEPGRIRLLPVGKLAVGEVWVNARPADDPQGDPLARGEGHYAIPAVNLVAAAEDHDPEYILLWLPGEGVYGTWDSDHGELLVFPGVTWSDIAADPLPYSAAQWDGPEPGVPFVPYPRYPYRTGRPY